MEIKPIKDNENIIIKRARIDYEKIFQYLNDNITVFVKDMNRYNVRYFKKLLRNKGIYDISVTPAFDEATKKAGYIISKNSK
jgi:hypothetical protein